MRKIKKYLFGMLCLVVTVLSFGIAFAQPLYEDNFSSYLLSGRADKDGRVANVYNITAVSADKSITQNIRCLFYPNAELDSQCPGDIRG
jgi:hypothetical protein